MMVSHKKIQPWLILIFTGLILAILGFYLLPFGLIPKPATLNCGPEKWASLHHRFTSREDVVQYLKDHELELMSGMNLPRLKQGGSDQLIRWQDFVINWNEVKDNIIVENRILYTLYRFEYHHPACTPTQTYILQVTSYGLASLYGCCGI